MLRPFITFTFQYLRAWIKINYFTKKRTIRCNSRIIELEDPLIMGILNVTPDSFYDGGMHNSPEGIKSHVEKMLAEGAGIIDIGGYSSRPGAAEVSEKEELERVTATLDIIRNDFPEAILSLDTFRSKVAAKAIEAYHVEIINDISAGKLDPEIVDVVAEKKLPMLLCICRVLQKLCSMHLNTSM
jgi:dihydropteroate synthase